MFEEARWAGTHLERVGRPAAQFDSAFDRHGQRLTPTPLRNLRLSADLNPWNRAVLAFLLALPPDTRSGPMPGSFRNSV